MSDLRALLLNIRAEHGRLPPEIVVDTARDPNHPLHSRFEWDDAVAAEKWRREQAHELIQSVKITYAKPSGKPSEIRAFHAVRTPHGHVYDPAEEVAENEMAVRGAARRDGTRLEGAQTPLGRVQGIRRDGPRRHERRLIRPNTDDR